MGYIEFHKNEYPNLSNTLYLPKNINREKISQFQQLGIIDIFGIRCSKFENRRKIIIDSISNENVTKKVIVGILDIKDGYVMSYLKDVCNEEDYNGCYLKLKSKIGVYDFVMYQISFNSLHIKPQLLTICTLYGEHWYSFGNMNIKDAFNWWKAKKSDSDIVEDYDLYMLEFSLEQEVTVIENYSDYFSTFVISSKCIVPKERWLEILKYEFRKNGFKIK